MDDDKLKEQSGVEQARETYYPDDGVRGIAKRANDDVVSGKIAPKVVSSDTPPVIESEDELVSYLERQVQSNRELTAADKQRMRRSERRERLVSGIGDAVRALSNVVFASQYAPNMYDPTKGMSEVTKARWDKAWKEREAENDRRYTYLAKLDELNRAKDAEAYKRERDAKADELERDKYGLLVAKDKRETALAEVETLAKLGRISTEEEKRRKAKIEADYAVAQQEASLAQKRAATTASYAAASASNAAASGHKRHLRLGGKTFSFDNADDYRRAVYSYVNQYNAEHPDSQIGFRREGSTAPVDKRIDEIAGELEHKWGKEDGQTGAEGQQGGKGGFASGFEL